MKAEKYYHVMALWMCAKIKASEVASLEKEANDLLGEENGSHLSDSLYDEAKPTPEAFAEVMKRMDHKLTS